MHYACGNLPFGLSWHRNTHTAGLEILCAVALIVHKLRTFWLPASAQLEALKLRSAFSREGPTAEARIFHLLLLLDLYRERRREEGGKSTQMEISSSLITKHNDFFAFGTR